MNPVRQSITIATAGHVDHGKTALVNWITGTNTDTLAEEKSRGLSINLGFAYYHLSDPDNPEGADITIGFIDVPGHSDFINNALAGISSADFALLVVAADDGVMPQTREHLAILSLLGITAGAVVITKIDKVSSEQLATAQRQILDLVAESTFRDASVFPVSTRTGAGMNLLVEQLKKIAQEHTGKSASTSQYPRFTVDRCFTVKGIGTVVTGTLITGVITEQDSLVNTADGEEVRIKGLRHHQHSVNHILAGERAALNINLPVGQIRRGNWLVAGPIYKPVHRIDVNLELLAPVQFKSGVSYHFYYGTSHQLVQIRKLGEDSASFFQASSAEPFNTLVGDRFILRDPACEHTIGGGHVVDIFVPRRGRNNVERMAELHAMDQDDYPALLSLLKQSSGGVDLQQFATGRNLQPEGIKALLAQLEQAQVLTTSLDIGHNAVPFILLNDFLHAAERQILQALTLFHESQPSQAGLTEPALNKAVEFKKSHLLFHAVLEHLITSQQIKRTGTLLHLPEHKARLSLEEKNFLDQIRPVLLDSDFLPPRTRELVEITGIKLGSLERILAKARKSGSLVQVATNRHYLPETMMRLAEFTESLAENKEQGFTVKEFRDQLGIGRNLCIEILEYFDRVGFTVRNGNSRFLRTSRENLFGKLDTGKAN